MTVDLARMMRAQYELQRTGGNDTMDMSLDVERRVQYIKDMALGLASELNEAMQEVGWKPWATSRHINDEAFAELRDAWQFLTNLMLAVTGRSPEQVAQMLETQLYQKLAINHQRMSEGYDGVSGKCVLCKRSLDEVELREVYVAETQAYDTYCPCGQLIKTAKVPA